ncbi:hypothetical protein M569_14406, partial [Genlisea aurea]
MKLLILVLLPIWVFSFPSASSPAEVIADPPVPYPAVPTDEDPSATKNPSDIVAKIKVVHHQDVNKRILVALVISSTLLGVILLLLSCFSIYRLKTLKKSNLRCEQESVASKSTSFGPLSDKFSYSKYTVKKGSVAEIDYHSLVAATNNFDEANVIGEGRLGTLYRAHFNGNYTAAVKKMCSGGLGAEKEFENEVNRLSRIQHPNIVSVLGYCVHGDSFFLVYDMVENGSLAFHLHG